MRGIAGSGKTHLIRQAGLEQYALSFSQINTMYHSPTLDINGKVKLPYLRKKCISSHAVYGTRAFQTRTIGYLG